MVLLGQASAAWGQAVPMVGGGSQSAAAGSPLKLAVSVLSAAETATVAPGIAPPEDGRVSLGLGYGHANRQKSYDISVGSVVPYSTEFRKDLISYAGAFQFAARFGRRNVLEISESATDRPLDSTGLTGYSSGLPGAASDALMNGASLTTARELRSDGSITLSHTISRRSTASVAFTHASSRSDGLVPAGSQLGSVRWERQLSPSTGFHAGYGFGSISYATAESAAGLRHDLDVGVDFSRPLPFSGRTVFEMETGSTILTDSAGSKLRLVLRASLARDLARRWSSRIEYSRPMQFVAGFGDPFLSDTVGLSVDGQLGRAWLLSISGGAARGSVGFNTGAPQYDSYTTSVRLRRQIGRAWHVEAEAFSTRFRFTGTVPAGMTIPSKLERQGVRAGLSWSAGLFRRR